MKNIVERLLLIIFYFSNLFAFGCLFTIKRMMKKMFMVKKIFIEIRLCNPMTHVFKGHVRIIKIYMMKFIVSIINKLKIIFFL